MQTQFTDISKSIQSNSFFISDNSHIHKIWFISIGAIDIRTLDIPNICEASYKFTHSKLHTVQILSPSAAYLLMYLCMSQLDSRNNFNLQNIFCLKSITFMFTDFIRIENSIEIILNLVLYFMATFSPTHIRHLS